MPDHRDILGAEFEVFNGIVVDIENVKPELLKERLHRGRLQEKSFNSHLKFVKNINRSTINDSSYRLNFNLGRNSKYSPIALQMPPPPPPPPAKRILRVKHETIGKVG